MTDNYKEQVKTLLEQKLVKLNKQIEELKERIMLMPESKVCVKCAG